MHRSCLIIAHPILRNERRPPDAVEHYPLVNSAQLSEPDLAGHPAWLASIAVLCYAGVGSSILDLVQSATPRRLKAATGEAVTAAFTWAWVLDQLPTS